MNTANVVEIVTFRLCPGVAEGQFLEANRRLEQEHLVLYPGLVSRVIARGDDGAWVIIVHWASTHVAKAAKAAFASVPATAGFMAMVDASSMVITRYSL
jgi:hypothetical protein